MAQWMVWSILVAAVVILELLSGTFYLLMIAIGLAGGALVAFAGFTVELQIIVAALVGLAATIVLHRRRASGVAAQGGAQNPNMHLDIGQAVQVDYWTTQGAIGDSPTARAMYRGAMWDVELAKQNDGIQLAEPGRFVIKEIQGSRLILTGTDLIKRLA